MFPWFRPSQCVIKLEGHMRGTSSIASHLQNGISMSWLMSDPLDVSFPAWDPDSFCQVTDQVSNCSFSSPQNQFEFELWFGKQRSLAGPPMHLLLLDSSLFPWSFSSCHNMILAFSQDSLLQIQDLT